jgi:hypothetical protein
VLGGPLRGDVDRAPRGGLAEAVVPVDDGGGAVRGLHARPGVGDDLAAADEGGVGLESADAVGAVPGEVGAHERSGDHRREVGGRPEALQHPEGESFELRRVDADHLVHGTSMFRLMEQRFASRRG